MDVVLFWLNCLPFIVFILLQLGEWVLPHHQPEIPYNKVDCYLNVIGLFIQGVLIPCAGIVLATWVLPLTTLTKGALPLNSVEAFALNFIVIDFFYYWQHRLFHQNTLLWQLHECHHSSPHLDIWATSRNNLFVNFLFVYLLFNPVLGYLCASSEGFFAGAMLTASLDIVRHSKIAFEKVQQSTLSRVLATIFVMPWMHRSHHNVLQKPHNFGANLIIWDKLFNSYQEPQKTKAQFLPDTPKAYRKQFYYPFVR